MTLSGTSIRERLVTHEAGHAVVGTLLYGRTFVDRIIIRRLRKYAETKTKFKQRFRTPQSLWKDGSLVQVSDPDPDTIVIVAATFAMSGMAAEHLQDSVLQPALEDLESLNWALQQLRRPIINLMRPDLAECLQTDEPFSGGLDSARAILVSQKTRFERVQGQLETRDNLPGDDVDELVDPS